MPKGEILVTDSLFIHEQHEKMINDAGYEVVRIDKPCISEEELCTAIKGKVGYILGGIEKVTSQVISSADNLKVISFTGAGYSEFIPAYKEALKKGISITAAKGGNAQAVAEFALTLCMMGARKIPLLQNPMGSNFLTTRNFSECVLGIVGYGDIGQTLAKLADKLGFSVLITSKSNKDLPPTIRQVSLSELLEESDIVSLHVDKLNGQGVLGEDQLKMMKKDSILVNVAFEEAVDQEILKKHLQNEKIWYLADHPIENSNEIPVGRAIGSNAQTAYNTRKALIDVSNQTTRSLLSILETGNDEFSVKL